MDEEYQCLSLVKVDYSLQRMNRRSQSEPLQAPSLFSIGTGLETARTEWAAILKAWNAC